MNSRGNLFSQFGRLILGVGGFLGMTGGFGVSKVSSISDDSESSPKSPLFLIIRLVLERVFCCEGDLRQQEQTEG